MILFDTVAVTNRGVYIPNPIWGPGSGLVALTFLASIAAAIWFGRWAKKRLYDTGQEIPALRWQLAILILPTLLVFFALGRPIGLDVPELTGFNFTGGIHLRGPFIALWFALSIYTAAFIAENVRAGIQAVARGQTEAAYSLGSDAAADHAPRHPAAGAPGDRAAADLALSQPDQELVARHRGRLHGRDGDHAHHAQSDRPGHRGDPAADGVLPDDLADDLGLHELV
jgi:hypothetical protein